MKKLTAIFLILVFILALTACGVTKGSGEPVASKSTNTHSNIETANTELSQPANIETMSGTVSHVGTETAYELTAEEIQLFIDIIKNDNWNTNGTADCFSDCKLIINGETYYYHSDCGTWNDNLNNQCLTVTDPEKETINTVLSQYITLGF